MTNCYKIKSPEELTDYLKNQGRDAFNDWDYQLQTNYGFVHELANGEVIFFENRYEHPAILFTNKKCFDDIINLDKFPIENPEQNMFDNEGDKIKAFHLQADYYRNHLNKVLKFNFPEITKEAAQEYLKKVIGRKIKNLTTGKDIVALISVIGELVKAETGGKWFLVKRYGSYNPTYEPNILTSAGNIYLMSSRIIGKIKWRTSRIEDIFIELHSTLTEPIKWVDYSKSRNNLIVLE
ncbi:hypothetical protein [Hymenobacter sp. BT730]|uniref:hypothetical protein n=1 Tax=Hymenobacter sp. BT730 TaxID=3063332 RepID=UPI0026E070AF|nr:hypothetical protein [Hymenobacter sp. BT730]